MSPVASKSGVSKRRIVGMDQWLVGLARLSTPSMLRRVLIGVGFALVALIVRAAASTLYGEVTGFAILLPAVTLAALAGGWTGGLVALFVCTGGGWAIVALTTTGRDGILSAIGGVATWNFVLVGLFMALVGASLRSAISRLSESETRFRQLADTAPSPIWLLNAKGEFEFVNAAVFALHGLSVDILRAGGWKAAVHPDDLETVKTTERAAAADRSPYEMEARIKGQDGAWQWMRAIVRPRFDGQGVFLGYAGISFDVTQTREALETAARAERRQAFLLDLSDRLRDLTDPEEIMTDVESALGALLDADRVGYGEVDQAARVVSMSRDWTAGVASAQGQFSLNAFGEGLIADLNEGRTINIEDVREDARTAAFTDAFDAIQTRALIRAPLIRNGRLRAFLYVHSSTPRRWTEAQVSLVEEVAARTWAEVERARAENETRESEQRFRAVADTAPVLIWVTRQDRTRAFVNQAYVDFYGADYETVRTLDWRDVLHPEDHARMLAESMAGEATQEPFSMEARYRRHDGEWRWLKSFSRPRLGGSEVIGFVGVAFDVTDAKRAEDGLKRINELLEERVDEALIEKAQAEAQLIHAQRMEAVGRLTGGVAHDFNNLLTVVIGALDIILRSEDPAKRRKLGEAALAAARRGESLTHQLLAFSRRQALRPEAIDLNALIRESEPLLRRAVGEAVDFKVRLKRGGARANVDPAQFEAALLNLIVNARDALGDVTGAKGRHARITVQTQACTVEAGQVAELAAGAYVCVAVSDNGEGMSPEIRDRVFEPFFTTKGVGKGTGLGLSQVYGFARQSGGGVHIESAPGQGAEIRLYLPPLSVEDAVTAPATASWSDAPLAEGERLLLVEDDPGVAAVALEILEAFGLEVELAENGQAALSALKAERFDVMLTDVVMPGGMSGVELARAAAAEWPGMRIALTSGYVGEDVDAVLSDTAWPLLRKPYSSDQLRALLERLSAASAG